MQNVDITIVGAGSAGLTLALLLAPLGLSLAVLEQGSEPAGRKGEQHRVSALNLASQRVLAHVGAWPAIAATAQAYDKMGKHSLRGQIKRTNAMSLTFAPCWFAALL